MILKIIKIILIFGGAAMLVYELSQSTKNYYIQALGISLLMIGLFLVNSKVPHKESNINNRDLENEMEDRR